MAIVAFFLSRILNIFTTAAQLLIILTHYGAQLQATLILTASGGIVKMEVTMKVSTAILSIWVPISCRLNIGVKFS